MELKNRHTGEVIIRVEDNNYNEALEAAHNGVISLESVDLTGANLDNAFLKGINLPDADLSGAHLNFAQIHGGDWTGAIFDKAEAIDSWFDGVTLDNASFVGANMLETNFENLTMKNADLTNADLGRAILFNADLSSSTLKNCDLGRATLHWVKLDGCYVEKLSWSGAGLLDITLKGARFMLPSEDVVICDGTWRRIDNIDGTGIAMEMYYCPPHSWFIRFGYFEGLLGEFLQTKQGEGYRILFEELLPA